MDGTQLNNDWNAYAVRNGLSLRSLLGDEGDLADPSLS